MNNEKAKDFFSAYYEGSLEEGLRQSFRRSMEGDSELRAEYRLFERTLDDLDALKLEEIEIPANLHETIAARLDRHLYEQKRSASASTIGFWRNLAFGGIALAAIVGALYNIPRSGGSTIGASLLPTISPPKDSLQSRIDFKAEPGSVVVEFKPEVDGMLTIRSAKDDKVLKRVFVKAGDQSETPLENPQPGAALLTAGVEGEPNPKWIALPGSQSVHEDLGQGDLSAFAKAVADRFQTPVTLEVADASQQLRWNFASSDALKSVMAALEGKRLTVEQRDGGLITISDR